MTTERDDATLRRYREASAALDEGPSAATRAAILAAAAREVEARPQPAGAPLRTRRRWPLAMAATLLLSTLAVMLATRTEEDMPRFTAPVERVQPAPPASAPSPPPLAAPTVPAPSAEPSAPGASSPDARPAATPVAPPAPRAVTPPQRTAPTEPPANGVSERRAAEPDAGADSARMKARSETAAESAELQRGAPAAPAAAPPPPAPAAQALPRSGAPAAAGMPGDARESATASKPEAARGGAADAASAPPPRSAREWLEHIVRLRAEARHAEADAELARFRERYPEVQVPPAALPLREAVPGTR